MAAAKTFLDRSELHGPFDVIGDVHGCADELSDHLLSLGYFRSKKGFVHPTRTAVFVGDLVDRGPKVAEALEIVMAMVADGTGYCVRGNHDDKLARFYAGRVVQLSREARSSLASIAAHDEANPGFASDVARFLAGLPYYAIFDDGRLVVAHGGLPLSLVGSSTKEAKEFALYGSVNGEVDGRGRPIRDHSWQQLHPADAGVAVVFGHTPGVRQRIINNTVNVDGGCAFGGNLVSIAYTSGIPLSESELTATPARALYAQPGAFRSLANSPSL